MSKQKMHLAVPRSVKFHKEPKFTQRQRTFMQRCVRAQPSALLRNLIDRAGIVPVFSNAQWARMTAYWDSVGAQV